MSRDEYQENPKYLLRAALLNASSREIERAQRLEVEAAHARSDAQRLGRLATLYGMTPRTRLLRAQARQSSTPSHDQDAA